MMTTFRLTRDTTDAEIEKATREDLICACFKGSFAVLRAYRRRTWKKDRCVQEAKSLRDLLRFLSRMTA